MSAHGLDAVAEKKRGRRASAVKTAALTNPLRPAARRSPRVLIIDDEPDLCRVAARYLRHGGFDCRAAADSALGLKLAVSESPDLILLDVVMPGLNGFSALKALRTDRRTATTPVILMTGHANGTEFLKSASADMNVASFVIKPVEWSEVIALIRDTLRAVPRSAAPDPIVRGPLRVEVKLRRAYARGAALALSPRRLDLLLALAHCPDGVSSVQLAATLQGAADTRALNVVVQNAADLKEQLRRACGQEMLAAVPGGYRLL
jgi:two-component system alkaline phosphatase synthesis response regulator PhoP